MYGRYASSRRIVSHPTLPSFRITHDASLSFSLRPPRTSGIGSRPESIRAMTYSVELRLFASMDGKGSIALLYWFEVLYWLHGRLRDFSPRCQTI